MSNDKAREEKTIESMKSKILETIDATRTSIFPDQSLDELVDMTEERRALLHIADLAAMKIHKQKNLIRRAYEKALNRSSSPYDLLDVAELVLETLQDKKWCVEIIKSIEEDTEEFDDFDALGVFWAEKLENPKQARIAFEKAERHAKTTADLCSLASSVATYLEDGSWVAKLSKQGESIASSAMDHVHLANMAFCELGDDELGVRFVEKALDLSKDREEFWSSLVFLVFPAFHAAFAAVDLSSRFLPITSTDVEDPNFWIVLFEGKDGFEAQGLTNEIVRQADAASDSTLAKLRMTKVATDVLGDAERAERIYGELVDFTDDHKELKLILNFDSSVFQFHEPSRRLCRKFSEHASTLEDVTSLAVVVAKRLRDDEWAVELFKRAAELTNHHAESLGLSIIAESCWSDREIPGDIRSMAKSAEEPTFAQCVEALKWSERYCLDGEQVSKFREKRLPLLRLAAEKARTVKDCLSVYRLCWPRRSKVEIELSLELLRRGVQWSENLAELSDVFHEIIDLALKLRMIERDEAVSNR